MRARGARAVALCDPAEGRIPSWLISKVRRCHPCAAAGLRMAAERSALRGNRHGVWVMARGKADHRLANFPDWQVEHAAAA